MPIEWPKGKRPVFIGAGNTKAERYSKRSLSSQAHEAASTAISDAGLKPADVDGLSVFPMIPHGNARNVPGYDFVDYMHMQHILPLDNVRWWCNSAGMMAVTSIIEAANALAVGACSYVLVWRALHHPVGERYNQTQPGAVPGPAQYVRPYGTPGMGSTQMQAMQYLRYLEKYQAQREQMAAVILNANRNAQLNEYAVWNGQRITQEDYLNARIISWPMCLFDNDMPVDEAGALVMTTEDRAKDTPHPGGYINGYAVTPYHLKLPRLIFPLEEQYECANLLSKNLYESAGVKPADIDLIHVYDGFSPMVWSWLEVFGFCGEGEGHDWVQDGRINIDGPHPMNTAGGNLGEGRLHGWSHIRETALQMMGRAGPRQLEKVDVALCEVGPLDWGGAAFVCTRE